SAVTSHRGAPRPGGGVLVDAPGHELARGRAAAVGPAHAGGAAPRAPGRGRGSGRDRGFLERLVARSRHRELVADRLAQYLRDRIPVTVEAAAADRGGDAALEVPDAGARRRRLAGEAEQALHPVALALGPGCARGDLAGDDR